MGEARAIGKGATARTGSAAMRSPVNWALLGLMIERPSYGYELAQRFERVYGDVLPISGVSHIYMALDALTARSLIEEVPETVGPRRYVRRRPRPNYRATPQGMDAYREHLIAQRGEDGQTTQLFARQLAMFCSEPGAALDVLRHYERASLETAEASKPPTDVPPANGSSELIDRLAREESRLTAQARLEWVKYARREFATLGAGQSAEP
jgi:DNA-binding PadR family transcriptional regulator